jgi:hypothetical protein
VATSPSSVPTTTATAVEKGFFPLDETWRIANSLSNRLSQETVYLATHMPFEEVSVVLERIGRVSVPPTTVWRQVQQQGARLHQAQHKRQEQVGVERTSWEHARYDPQARVGLSLDGGMVSVRGEGWKELKVGSLGAIERQWTPDGQVVKLNDLHYVGVVGDVERFKATFWELAVRRGVLYAGHTVVTADGAAWIWRVASDLFPCSVQIVDWYHAMQHLAQAAADHYPDDASAAASWRKALQTRLFQGQLDVVIAALEPVANGKHQGYFKEHKRRMQYQEFWESGYPIGSGAVESGIKQFKQRLTGAGMRWSRPAIERMVTLRAAALSRTFDDLWDAA